jgi:hypothetical protein
MPPVSCILGPPIYVLMYVAFDQKAINKVELLTLNKSRIQIYLSY